MWFCDMQDTLYYDDVEEREDAGTPPIIQKIRASLAFWVKEYIGYETMSLRERVYSEMAMKRLVSNPNVRDLTTGIDLLAQNVQSKIADELEKKHGVDQKKFEGYLENAKKIALSLPDISHQVFSVPKGVDRDLVLFHI